jgi:SNF2 family DNA or RNA helicase
MDSFLGIQMKPFAHQTRSIKILAKNPRIFDMSDPGTGKTYVQIMDFAARRKQGAGPALVIAPKSLLTAAWGSDIKKFAPHLKTSIAFATNRDEALDAPADIYITNHDAVKALTKKTDKFWKKFKGGTLIVDESSAFKHHTSQRSAALAKITKHFEYRRLMSGTPNSNGICDIWHQMLLVDDGKRLGKSFFAFRGAVCTPEQVGPNINAMKWTDKENAEAIVSALVADVTIRHRFEDCTDIPPNHQYSVEFQLSKKHMAKYLELETNSILLLKNTSVTAINAAVLYSKLLQASSGAVYDDNGSYALLGSERYELVMDMAEARAHSVVFFNWTHQRDAMIKIAKARGLAHTLIDGTVTDKARNVAVEDFQKGLYRVMFAHPQSAGHGLTLTKGTTTIWASPTANLEHYLQGLKRIYRIGQTERTETIMVLAPGTIEERVYESLMAKDVKMASLLDYLKQEAA